MRYILEAEVKFEIGFGHEFVFESWELVCTTGFLLGFDCWIQSKLIDNLPSLRKVETVSDLASIVSFVRSWD